MAQALRLAKVASYLGRVAGVLDERFSVEFVQHGEGFCLTLPQAVAEAFRVYVPVTATPEKAVRPTPAATTGRNTDRRPTRGSVNR